MERFSFDKLMKQMIDGLCFGVALELQRGTQKSVLTKKIEGTQ